MNKKAQGEMQIFFVVFMAIIVGVVLFQASAQNVGTATNTVDIVNYSFTSAAVGEDVYITAYRAISGVTIYNQTTGNGTQTLVPADNYTVTNNALDSTTSLSVKVTTAAVNSYAEQTWYISGTAQPTTYIADGGGRSIASLIVIFLAIAIGLIALRPVYEGKFRELLGR